MNEKHIIENQTIIGNLTRKRLTDRKSYY